MTYSIGKCFYFELYDIRLRRLIVVRAYYRNQNYFIKLRLDDGRIKEVGPNMACAEWLMKNGAQIRWKGCKEFVSHYDFLPTKLYDQFQIEEVHAGREASISHVGFRFFGMYTNSILTWI